MNSIIELKNKLKTEIFNNLIEIEKVISVSIVGSFIDQKDLTGISDIDTVVICKSLDKKVFNQCINSIKRINLGKYTLLKDYTLKVNPTFGPLKFDKSKLAVVHLMIYDIIGHKNHVISSPFTCFDWERSKHFVGQSLSSIFPVGTLQVRDFNEARRSTESYLNDLKKDAISYREYNFDHSTVKEVKKQIPLDERHKGEFSYHIIKNLVVNYNKLINGVNDTLSKEKIVSQIRKICKNNSDYDYAKKYLEVSKIKEMRLRIFPIDTIFWAEGFVKIFKNNLSNDWKDSKRVNFIRHFKTTLNNGTYLGQNRDPDIDSNSIFETKIHESAITYSSPLKRCLQTAKIINNKTKIVKDIRLLEFNYGKAEGMDYDELTKKYPGISSAWAKGKDPRFPNGENTADVFKRLMSFMNDLSKTIDNNKQDQINIISHNGIIRCLIGNAFNINIEDWYRIVIPHGIPLQFLYRQGLFYPNISRDILVSVFQNIGFTKK